MFNTSKSQSSKQAGGAKRDRTADLLRARQALSQLSYSPSMLVFFAFCDVAAPHSFSHIHKYAPSLIRRAPCKIQKILRLVILPDKKEELRIRLERMGTSLFKFKALDRDAYISMQVIQ